MANPKGFMVYDRKTGGYRPVPERVGDFNEVNLFLERGELAAQASRCMDCGVPFCHGPHGCPLGNRIPIWNDLMYRGDLVQAISQLHATNNLPEVTGRVCPAPCETACCVGYNRPAVTIKQVECQIVEQAWQEGLIRPQPPTERTGRRVAVVGSGPAGLAASQQLNRAGHEVVAFERADRIGGLLTYGIPNFKLDRRVLNRRLAQFEAEGIRFVVNAEVGRNVPVDELRREFDAIALCGGCTVARELPVPGSDLAGVFRAMVFLTRQNRVLAGDTVAEDEAMTAEGKHVVVIGGGDTGADCIGTSVRQGAKSITQLEIMPQPPEERAQPWPLWPYSLNVSSSHQEAELRANLSRVWSVNTKEYVGENGRVKALSCVRVEWEEVVGSRPRPVEVPGSEFEIEADLVLLAMGFVHPEHGGMVDQLGLELDERGNVATGDPKHTSTEGVFAAGDMRRGQSLVVTALAEGRDMAYDIDEWLMGESVLPRSNPR